MKRLLFFLIALVFSSCSFDNKTGIWKDASNTPISTLGTKSISDNKSAIKYEDIFAKNKPFNEEKESLNSSNIKISSPVKIANWFEEYGIPTNNISNFSYSDNKILLSKSRKLSNLISGSTYPDRKMIFYKKKLISHDHKGTIYVYSLNLNKKIFEYNFYKKKFKKFNKKINLIINKDVLYAADNLGYLYALNLNDNSIIWAKNYGVPFRSNLKFINNQIFVANQDNVDYSINPNTGDKNWQFATSLTFFKSDFKNNFALDLANNNLFFLNTSVELYSINYFTQKINWVLNFKNSSLAEDSALFLSQPIVLKNNNLIITTEKAALNYDTLTGSRNWSLSIEPIFKPIITSNHTYVILQNDLLICVENTNGNIVWSKNIFRNLNKKIKNKFYSVVDFKIVNNEVNIYSNNGYLLSFNPSSGNLNNLTKISKNGIASKIIFLDNNMLFFNKDNKLLKFN